MALLNDRDRESVRGLLAAMKNPVTLVFFTQAFACESCEAAKQILDEVASLSDLVTVEDVNFVLDAARAESFGVDRVPAIVVSSGMHTGIRFYGAPSGYEFMSLLDAIVSSSSGEPHLSDASLALVRAVEADTTIQVYVTPT